ncbi:hypothetical protein [Microscilla marina]|uniref:Uncharacterized protein n=1 Tax=Microscilla marina ATCC 23134 TaxID=313606 RepID=A1ZUA1_MICM2|nr:hypothetical protein [Microscilla marina]EAY26072.1 hypothetical protein M23134_06421 [Microscilla marina ATCC 23134]
MNIRIDTPFFKQQAKEIEPLIPRHYSGIVRHYLPEMTTSHIQTVKKGYVADWLTHCVLAFIAKTKTRIPANIELDLPNGILYEDVVIEEVIIEKRFVN